jgi:hypothetical protein
VRREVSAARGRTPMEAAVRIYAITEHPDGTLVVTQDGRVLVSVFDHERRLGACLDRIAAEAGPEWTVVKTVTTQDGDRSHHPDARLDAR